MEKLPDLTENEKKVYDIINKDSVNNIFCCSYPRAIARRANIGFKDLDQYLSSLYEKKYIKGFCIGTPFCRHISYEGEILSSKFDDIKLKYKKSKDKDIIDDIVETRDINTISLWIYLKLISVLKKKIVVTLKEVIEEISISQESKNDWVNSAWLHKIMCVADKHGFSQWEII